jgi:hypothetical protein
MGKQKFPKFICSEVVIECNFDLLFSFAKLRTVLNFRRIRYCLCSVILPCIMVTRHAKSFRCVANRYTSKHQKADWMLIFKYSTIIISVNMNSPFSISVVPHSLIMLIAYCISPLIKTLTYNLRYGADSFSRNCPLQTSKVYYHVHKSLPLHQILMNNLNKIHIFTPFIIKDKDKVFPGLD